MAEPVERLVVTFFGHPCMTVRGQDGSIFVSLRDLCDLLGLRVASQARRLRNDPDLREGLARFGRTVVVHEPGGYERYLKPFRTTEDCHVLAALLGYLTRVARRYQFPRRVAEARGRAQPPPGSAVRRAGSCFLRIARASPSVPRLVITRLT